MNSADIDPESVAAAKTEIRRSVLDRRRRRIEQFPEEMEAAAAGWRNGLLPEILDRTVPGDAVAAFLPAPGEPPLRPVLQSLSEQGRRVLVPRVLPGRTLGWVRWEPTAPIRRSRFGVEEPLGPDLGPQGFTEAVVRLVPALAVGRDGTRLGYGGGYYDGALSGLGSGTGSTWAVVFGDEVLDAVPAEPHDARLRRAWLPDGPLELGD